MPIEKSKNHYIGKNGCSKKDCANAILYAFCANENEIKKCPCRGGGNSPSGECGAYCAAKYLLSKNLPEKIKDFEGYFKTLAGHLTCKEIRKLKKLSCLGCVEKAAEYLSKNMI